MILLLETDIRAGLSSHEAEDRLRRFGPNELARAEPGGPLGRLGRQLNHPLVYVLLVAAVVALLLGETVDSSVIFGVVAANSAVGFIQESKAEAALNALRAMVTTEARVRRDGHRRGVPSEELVPGDVVHIEAGDRVPADLRLVELHELTVDESALTGESLPVVKDEVALPADTPVADRHNMVYSGTLVTHGTALGVAVATGEETELGEIHRLVSSAEQLETPLTRKLAGFSKILTVVIVGLAVLTFLVGMARGEQADDMFSAAVALAVGAIPEGLPAAVTITLAIGMTRMATRRAVIRHMPAVETLGSTTVVCSDKTGTLTRNQMTVRATWTATGSYSLTGSGYDPDGSFLDASGLPLAGPPAGSLRWTLIIGAGCNDAKLVAAGDGWRVIGDPTEAALLVAAAKAGIDRTWVQGRFPRVGSLPFSSDRQYMATLHDDGPDGRILFVKGAVERVVGLCSSMAGADGVTAPLDPAAVLGAAEQLAGTGLRVLATAMARVAPGYTIEPDRPPDGLTLTGLQAMLDPPRPEAVTAVASCHDAGIDVKMITGDHASTAVAIATQLGIVSSGCANRVLTGSELAAIAPEDYPDAVQRAAVFARVSPEQKLRLVRGLQTGGQVVAMTGDGVNDAPALRQADIGVAMGRTGTEVAKDAADMILTDDHFATIEAAVEEGRAVFDNLTKFIAWTLPTNMGEGLVILVAILLGATLPLVPVQILWINMTTAVALGLTLAFEPKEPDIMRRKPRDPGQPILTAALLVRVLLVSALMVGGASWLFHWEQSLGASVAEARTAALNLFVAVEALYLFSCRSFSRTRRSGPFSNGSLSNGLLGNRWLIGGVAAQSLGQVAITYLPAMNHLFSTAPLGGASWLRILALSSGIAAVLAVEKLAHRQLRPAAPSYLERRGGDLNPRTRSPKSTH